MGSQRVWHDCAAFTFIIIIHDSLPQRTLLGTAQSESEVIQSCPTLCDPMDCSLPNSSTHGIFQARIWECVAISFSRGSSRPRDRTLVSCTTGRLLTVWATREALCKLKCHCSAHRDIFWPCPPMNSYNKKKRLTHPFKGQPFPLEMFWETEDPFNLLPHCLSLSILSFDFSSSLLLSLWLYKRTWHPDSDKMVTLKH